MALEKNNVSVACEIGVSSTCEHEVANVHKCISAGFSMVVAVATDPKRATVMRARLEGELIEAGRCRVMTPEEVFARFYPHLKTANSRRTHR